MIIIPKRNFDETKRHFKHFNLVDFNVTKSGKRFLATRVRLRSNKFTQLITLFRPNRDNSNSLVKKSVRVDEDLYSALCDETHSNKTFFTKTISEAVLNTISTGQIDLIEAKWFSHKITIYFTAEEYRLIQDALDEIRSRGLKGVTFSSLVRSILYKHLGIVEEAVVANKDKRLSRKPLSRRGITSGMATNPIRLGNKQQQKSYKISMKGYNYENQI